MSPSSQKDGFVAGVLRWYDRNGRHELPWRDTAASPYEVLVAEVMLQKTSAQQVIAVFEAFVGEYPNPSSLVEAPEEEIASEIKRLGLRKRAGHLREIAERIEEEHDGDVPDSRDELLELNGVGDYTAASVLAHAYGEDVSAVDTNVSRILSRAFGVTEDERPDAVEKIARALVPAGRGSDFVHGLIDLGSDVCTPSDPECGNCPAEESCDHAAAESG